MTEESPKSLSLRDKRVKRHIESGCRPVCACSFPIAWPGGLAFNRRPMVFRLQFGQALGLFAAALLALGSAGCR
ncbi:MAG: hypothetical protein HN969_01840, partial [Verrucomicrobia bacterium]|nr:hypothetical protein [Verrucomicrobiota bacterium]